VKNVQLYRKLQQYGMEQYETYDLD
jgi:hypothetical protein